MKTSQLLSIGLFTIALVITVYVWLDRLRGTNALIEEAFENDSFKLSDVDLVKRGIETNPTDADAVSAHKTLLRYIKNDITNGAKFINDLGKRFFGDNVPLRKDLNIQTLLDNYISPLQEI